MAWLATYILEVTHNQVSINYIVENERMSIKPYKLLSFLTHIDGLPRQTGLQTRVCSKR